MAGEPVGQTIFGAEADTPDTLLRPWTEYRGRLRLPCTATDTRLEVHHTERAQPTGVLVLDDGAGNREYVAYGGVTQDAFLDCVRGAFPEDGGRAARDWPAETFVDQTIIGTHHRVITDALIAVEEAVIALQNGAAGDQSVSVTWSGSVGVRGTGNGQFNGPWGIAAAANGDLWVSDFYQHRIQRWTHTSATSIAWAQTVGTIAGGTANGAFKNPRGVCVSANGDVWVADSTNHRVQRFSSAGVWQQTIGSYGTANGQFNGPYGIAAAANGDVWVSDAINYRLQRLNAAGVWQQNIATSTSGFATTVITDVAIDSTGRLLATDSLNHLVHVWSAAGVYEKAIGSYGTSPGQFNGPWGVFTDTHDNIWVADSVNHRVQVFDGNGTYLTMFGTNGTGDGQLYSPRNVAVDADGWVTVTDSNNHRLTRWKISGAGYSTAVPHGHSLTLPVYFTESASQTVNATATKTITQACPSTHPVAIGGGCMTESGTASATAITASYPNYTVQPNQWVCTITNTSSNTRLASAHAICVDTSFSTDLTMMATTATGRTPLTDATPDVTATATPAEGM